MEQTQKQPAIQSVARAIAILRCFEGTGELGLTEISRLVGLHKSTAAGIINTLKAERFLEQNAQSGKFRLGMDLFFLAAGAKPELSEICEPFLNRLLDQTGETVNFAVRDGRHVVYVEKKESPHSMRICTSVGQRMPLYCTGIGKAILAHLDTEEARELLGKTELKKITGHTITDIDELLRQCEVIRREGVAWDMEEWEYGLVCVAAPIFDKRGAAIGAVSVSGPSMRMEEKTRRRIAAEVRKISIEISEEIAGV